MTTTTTKYPTNRGVSFSINFGLALPSEIKTNEKITCTTDSSIGCSNYTAGFFWEVNTTPRDYSDNLLTESLYRPSLGFYYSTLKTDGKIKSNFNSKSVAEKMDLVRLETGYHKEYKEYKSVFKSPKFSIHRPEILEFTNGLWGKDYGTIKVYVSDYQFSTDRSYSHCISKLYYFHTVKPNCIKRIINNEPNNSIYTVQTSTTLPNCNLFKQESQAQVENRDNNDVVPLIQKSTGINYVDNK